MNANGGFVLRAPWYVRERQDFSLRSSKALRPEIQMYDSPQFVKRLLKDPRDSLLPDKDDDFWSYPVPNTPSITAKGRERFATFKLVRTKLRKLYQPGHDRFYAVVVEVFCDKPGLPRAGSHTDFEVGLVMRRRNTSVFGQRRPVRRLARNLLVEMAKQENITLDPDAEPDADVRDVFWADMAARQRFEEDNADLLATVTAHTDIQAWMVGDAGGQWRGLGEAPPAARPPDAEEEFPMWRIPPNPDDCDAAQTRSLWFGTVPTYSADHWVDEKGEVAPKLDDHGVYELQCFVRMKPEPGKEDCPPKMYWSYPSEPFRLAAPFDPDGTKNHNVSIAAPDLRRLAARAAQKAGPGGVRIMTPPKSQFVFNPSKIPEQGQGRIGPGGGICMFAFELFFLVALFLFLMFSIVIVLAFQLWFLLALRFCIPPSISFTAVADFFAAGGVLADLNLAVNAQLKLDFDAAFGTESELLAAGDRSPSWAEQLDAAKDPVTATKIFSNDASLTEALVLANDPSDALEPEPLPTETKPEDPLCAVP